MKYISSVLLSLFLYSPWALSDVLSSPNNKIRVTIATKHENEDKRGQPQFKIDYFDGNNFVEVLPFSSLGVSTVSQSFSDNLKYVSATRVKPIHEKYEMVSGKKRVCENFGNEQRFTYINDAGTPFEIAFRAYNDGVSFKYRIGDKPGSSIRIADELTSYSIPSGTRRWLQEYEIGYEDYYPFSSSGKRKDSSQEWGYPALFETKEGVYLLISEANVGRENAATRLTNKTNFDSYEVLYPGSRDENEAGGVTSQLPWDSAWNVLMIGELGDIVFINTDHRFK